ncbi:MAG: imelysin family protein [Roseovarius sp.]|jgi:predicted lipoprotein|uniref:imelysin family protein n=1 Tax=Roseovarius sp. TaxID=1486281 RepID=UPI0032EEB130
MRLALALTLCLALPAHAGVDKALDTHILPGFERFAERADRLSDAADEDCRAANLRPDFHAAFDASMTVGDLRLGPSETGALSVVFWPDPRGFTQRTLTRLIAEKDPIAHAPEDYPEVSIAARGLFALEMLLYDPAFMTYDEGSYTCALVTTIATDLEAQARALYSAWNDHFAPLLREAGAPGNATFLSEDEALRALYTQVLSALEFTANKRLGLPMGTFERPRPALAEARRSGRSLRQVRLAAGAAHGLATALADWDLPQSDAALARIEAAADTIENPAFQDITDPQARPRIEVLQQAVNDLHDAIAAEIGTRLGIAPGFNAQDGD